MLIQSILAKEKINHSLGQDENRNEEISKCLGQIFFASIQRDDTFGPSMSLVRVSPLQISHVLARGASFFHSNQSRVDPEH